MQNPVLETYEIFATSSAVNGATVHLANSNGEEVAFARFDRKTKRLAFTTSVNLKLPAGVAMLESFADADLTQSMSRGLLNGQTPATIIVEAAYTYVLTHLVAGLDEPSVETDDYDIVLRAKSGVVVPGTSPAGSANPADPAAPNPAAAARSKAGKKPRRRKTNVAVWL